MQASKVNLNCCWICFQNGEFFSLHVDLSFLTVIFIEKEEQLKQKTTNLETLLTKATNLSTKLCDVQKKLETMEKNNSSLQLDNGKLEQNLANEQAKVEMLKHTLTCVYKCVSV